MTDLRVSSNTEAEYNGVSVREDLEDTIYRVTPSDCPLFSMIAKKKATQELHEWTVQALRSASNTNAHQDGEVFSVVARTAPTRRGNRCQIFTDVASVTGRMEAALKAGRKSEINYQKLLAGLALKTDIEKTILTNQAKVTGASGTAPKLAGLPSWLISNTVRAGDGSNPTGDGTDTAGNGTQRVFTEDMLTTMLQDCYDNSNQPPDTILCPAGKKVAISGFGGNQTRMGKAESKRLVAAVDVYVGDFSTVECVPDRFFPDTRNVYAINPDFMALAWFRPMQTYQIAKTADSEEWAVVADVTLAVLNEAAHGVVADLS